VSRRDLIRLVVVAVLIGVGAIIVRATSPSANSASTAIGHAPSGASVLVASPLAPVVMQMAPADRISIGSAEALASQVIAGAPSDVLITTDAATALVLQSKGLTGPPVVIAHDRLVVITPPNNPGRIHTFADLAKPGVRLVVGGPKLLYIAAFGVGCLTAEILIPYHRYSRYLKALTLVLFAYVATAFTIRIPWGEVAAATFLPRVSWNRDYMLMLVAIFGTT